MVCTTSCVLSIAFISASLFVTFNHEKDERLHQLMKVLTPVQKAIYKEIRNERRTLYLQGFTLGFILSLIALYNMKNKMNRWGNLCMVGAITFTVSYFYYILMPKKYEMISHLDKKEEREAWLKVYRIMQFYYHLGFVLGIIAVILFCNMFLDK
jgi:uncharacterized membrane protein YkgB